MADAVDPATWMRVSDVLQAYADAIDRGDIPAIVALFAPDATWDYTPTKAHRGHDEIAHFFGERMPAFARTSHNVGPPVVRRDPATRRLRSTAYYEAKHQLKDGGTYCVWGRYVDELVEEGDRVLIARRSVVVHVKEGTDRAYVMLPRAGD